MVGLVLVSHSRRLADALTRFVEAAGAGGVPLAVAAGIEAGPGDDSGLGTDALAIERAIRSVSGPEGVLVLMDLGSAVLAAESALELLPEEVRAGVRLCAAPLVEGAVAAAARIGAGGSLQEALDEATRALAPKAEQLGIASPAAGGPAEGAGAVGRAAAAAAWWQEASATVLNTHGLHLRPAARLVRLAARFRAEVQVGNPRSGKSAVPAVSLNGLTTLGLAQGDTVVFQARGPGADQALQALCQLARERFGEPPAAAGEGGPPAAAGEGVAEPPAAVEAFPAELQAQAGAMRRLQGIAVSEGFATGPLTRPTQAVLEPSERPSLGPEREWAQLVAAMERETQLLDGEARAVSARVGADKGVLFEAFRLILQDAALREPLREGVFAAGLNAEQALVRGIRELAGRYEALADPYARQRAADIQHLGQRVLRRLRGAEAQPLDTAGAPGLLALRELSPADAARLEAGTVLGVLTVRGGATSHSAVLLRALGIPSVSGLPESVLAVTAGTTAALDGAAGTLWLRPDAQVLRRIQDARTRWQRRQADDARKRREPAVSLDGKRFEVEANIASVSQAREAVEQGAEGVGVLRTEFLFLDRAEPPSEQEQLEALEEIAAQLRGRPLTVRSLDVGGDKPLSYLSQPEEANPYLGLRGVRLCLLRPELFRTQLRAVLRAAESHPVRLLLPMVSTLQELEGALRELTEARAGLTREGLRHRWPVAVGMMVETPSAALLIDRFLERVDFVSIGTNDLTQYTLAAERGNPALAGLEDALHPAVLALIRRVAAAAARHGKAATVCGEIAGDPLAAAVLAGLGIGSFSLNPAGIPAVKQALRRLRVSAASRWARGLLRLAGAAEVRRRAAAYYEALPTV